MAKLQIFPESKSEAKETALPSGEAGKLHVLDIFLLLLRYRMLIICMVLLSAYLGFSGSLKLDNIYRSEATIIPRQANRSMFSLSALGGLGGLMADQLGLGGSETLDKLELVLKSQYLSQRVIEKHPLIPVLFPERFKAKPKNKSPGLISKIFMWIFASDTDKDKSSLGSGKRKRKKITVQDAQKRMKRVLKVYAAKKKRTVTVTVDLRDPYMAKRLVMYVLNELSAILREQILADAQENIRFFQQQIAETSDPLLREKLYNMLASEIEKQTFARAQKYYGFVVVDPPVVPDLNKKIRPSRVRIILLRAFLGGFFGVVLAVMIEFFKKTKAYDPIRYSRLMEELRFRIKGKRS